MQERLDSLSGGCSLSNMIQFDDTDNDGKLSINEFYVAFSKLYSEYLVIVGLLRVPLRFWGCCSSLGAILLALISEGEAGLGRLSFELLRNGANYEVAMYN